ncbi:unnamed protein product [[Candida] boidinii]|uniref:Unnamed protein product n=1 Tax=Candida boidinii TaxID=5477 RepID=A0ACB5U4Y0_CANBO|nr:unnamed protein product [[Candida] boidinii]
MKLMVITPELLLSAVCCEIGGSLGSWMEFIPGDAVKPPVVGLVAVVVILTNVVEATIAVSNFVKVLTLISSNDFESVVDGSAAEEASVLTSILFVSIDDDGSTGELVLASPAAVCVTVGSISNDDVLLSLNPTVVVVVKIFVCVTVIVSVP